jgi:hypothetical protein
MKVNDAIEMYLKDKRKNIEGNKYEQKTHTTKSLANDNKKRLEKL